MDIMLNARAQLLLKTLVERYISDGQPVGSRTLSKYSGLDLSPATIRNVMADLEEMGFVASPHTSSGRVPTPRGYRLFVDTLLTNRRYPRGVGTQPGGGVGAGDNPHFLQVRHHVADGGGREVEARNLDRWEPAVDHR